MCFHENTLICQTEGDIVCCDCGLVIDTFLTRYETHAMQEPTRIHHEANHHATDDYFDIVNFCSRFHIEDCASVSKIFEDYKKVKKEIRFKKEEIISYVIYQFLKSEKFPRSMKEVSKHMLVSSNSLWKIERSQSLKLPSSTPKQLLETYYRHVDLSFKDMIAVSDLIDSVQSSDTSFAPSSICSGLCYFYCKEKKIQTSMKKIASIFHTSVMSIHRFLKHYRNQRKS